MVAGLASAAAQGAVLLDASSSNTSDVAALGLQLGGGARQLWLANLTAQPTTVAVSTAGAPPALVEEVQPGSSLSLFPMSFS